MKKQLMWAVFFLFGGTLLGCRRQAVPELAPETIVQNAASRMNEMAGFHFVIEREGEPAFVDPPENILAFRQAEGDYTAPDRARAVVRIIGPGLITDVSVISVADIQWQTNPLTGQWEELPPNWGFNPTVLFDNQLGLQMVLAADMISMQLTGLETVNEGPDGRFYHITGQIAGERLYEMSGGLIGPQMVTADLWIAPQTFELVRAIVVEPEAAGASIWQVDFSKFDQAIPIEPPDL